MLLTVTDASHESLWCRSPAKKTSQKYILYIDIGCKPVDYYKARGKEKGKEDSVEEVRGLYIAMSVLPQGFPGHVGNAQ